MALIYDCCKVKEDDFWWKRELGNEDFTLYSVDTNTQVSSQTAEEVIYSGGKYG